MIQLIERAANFRHRTAIKEHQASFSYEDLLSQSQSIALGLLNGQKDLNEARVAFLVPAGFTYASIQWAIWRAGGIAVPLCEKHPLPSLQYVLEDTGASIVIFSPEFESLLHPLRKSIKARFIPAAQFISQQGRLPEISPDRSAMILYTSGTTGAPKGVVSTHRNIETQIVTLVKAWGWHTDDQVLNLLPLHHVHGIINLLSCALWSGACCEFIPKFSPEAVYEVFRKGEVNVFMAVPTIYFKLIAHYKTLPIEDQQAISRSLKPFRLMVSGSAALPVSVLEDWKNISGHTLLERYGMTEMGMAISNPYQGERKPGFIGQPLPGVTIRIADEDGNALPDGSPGEIQVKGANVFREYWKKEAATREAFTEDGWFKTGDVAVFEEGSYKILGRNSVDIIKSGGYKISALEIEEVLRTHPAVEDCGVVGIPDDEWGELIGACLVVKDQEPDLNTLADWLKERLPAYKTPRKFIVRNDLPRNAMGKVTKKELKSMF